MNAARPNGNDAHQGSGLSYLQILEANSLMQNCGDETYWLTTTRTVQRSALFPISGCIALALLNAFYRHPSLLRKIESKMKAEDIADRARGLGVKLQSAQLGWLLPAFYLLGREWLLSMGMIRPHDAAQDVVYLLDFWRRFQLAWRRNDGHLTSREFGRRAQILPDRTLEVFAADLHLCEPGDALNEAARNFMATASQYCFVAACECRINLHNSGPYRLDDTREMLVRDFMDLAECGLPWLNGVATDIPYNNLTVTIATRGCHFNIVDDWGSFESVPELTSAMVSGVGLYTSDPLSNGFIPVGMGSVDELTSVFKDLTNRLKHALTNLWTRFAAWSRDQLLDAGALTYSVAMKDLAHIAGVFEADDWLAIDPRAERFRPLLNDEYAEGLIGELVGGISLPSQQASPFVMMQHTNRPARMFTPLPCSLVADDDYVASTGELQHGTTHIDAKVDRFRTSRGLLTLAEYNRAASMHESPVSSARFRYLCETWVKYHRHTPLADELYRLAQRHSRQFHNRGASHPDDHRKAEMASMRAVLHCVGVKRHSSAADVAAFSGMVTADALRLLQTAQESGRVIEVDGKFVLTPLARVALEANYALEYSDVRANSKFQDGFDEFEKINVELKGLITNWQTIEIGGHRLANDHEDKNYDLAVIMRLGALHERVEDLLARLALIVPRLDYYRVCLLSALEKAENGAVEWVSAAKLDSYHTVWFQLHEDLLRIAGRRRSE